MTEKIYKTGYAYQTDANGDVLLDDAGKPLHVSPEIFEKLNNKYMDILRKGFQE